VWVQGRKILHVSEVKLGISAEQTVAAVSIEDVPDTVQGLYDFSIYRFGTRIFKGRIEVVDKSVDPIPLLRFEGRNMIQALMNIPVESASYAASDLKALIEAIFSDYVEGGKQVTLGTVEEWLENITVTLEEVIEVTAYDLLLMAVALGGAVMSVNADGALNVG